MAMYGVSSQTPWSRIWTTLALLRRAAALASRSKLAHVGGRGGLELQEAFTAQ